MLRAHALVAPAEAPRAAEPLDELGRGPRVVRVVRDAVQPNWPATVRVALHVRRGDVMPMDKGDRGAREGAAWGLPLKAQCKAVELAGYVWARDESRKALTVRMTQHVKSAVARIAPGILTGDLPSKGEGKGAKGEAGKDEGGAILVDIAKLSLNTAQQRINSHARNPS